VFKVSGKKKPTLVDLFGGCGGTITGFKDAGFRAVATVEIDPEAAKTCKLNHPLTRILVDDIQNVEPFDLLADTPFRNSSVDVLSACPPCQGFSTLTTKNGRKQISDPRNELVGEIVRFVKDLNPMIILIENVPPLLKSTDYAKVVERLSTRGYKCRDAVLNAVNFGLPQRRRRAISICSRVSDPSLPTGKPVVRKSVADAIRNSPPPRKQLWLHTVQRRTSELVRKRIAAIPLDGGGREDLPEELQLFCHKRVNGFHDVYGRMSWDAPSPTLTRFFMNPSKGRFLHPELNRTISPFEALILQGFPNDYSFDREIPISKIVSMIGEAFPPSWAKEIALSIKDYLVSKGEKKHS